MNEEEYIYVNDDHDESPNNMGYIVGEIYLIRGLEDSNFIQVKGPSNCDMNVHNEWAIYFKKRLVAFKRSHRQFDNKINELLK